MKTAWRWIVRVGSFGILSVIIGYPVALTWQMHRVRQLCSEMAPGTPIAKIRPAIERHWLWSSIVAYEFDHPEQRPLDPKTKVASYSVPASMTMGDMECAIWHDGAVVVDARVLGP